MALFQYIAKDANGSVVKGQVEAADRASAIAAVRAKQLLPTALGEVKSSASQAPAAQAPAAQKKNSRVADRFKKPEEKKKGTGLNKEININIKMPSWMRGKIKTKVLTQFTRQLATLVNAGLPLMRGLEVLKRQMKDPQMKEALEGIGENISSGGTFSESLSAYPKIFDNLYVNMVKAGEPGGVLEVVLGRLAEFAEKAEKISQSMKETVGVKTILLYFQQFGMTPTVAFKIYKQFKEDPKGKLAALKPMFGWLNFEVDNV